MSNMGESMASVRSVKGIAHKFCSNQAKHFVLILYQQRECECLRHFSRSLEGQEGCLWSPA